MPDDEIILPPGAFGPDAIAQAKAELAKAATVDDDPPPDVEPD